MLFKNKSLRPCALDESSLSNGRVKIFSLAFGVKVNFMLGMRELIRIWYLSSSQSDNGVFPLRIAIHLSVKCSILTRNSSRVHMFNCVKR